MPVRVLERLLRPRVVDVLFFHVRERPAARRQNPGGSAYCPTRPAGTGKSRCARCPPAAADDPPRRPPVTSSPPATSGSLVGQQDALAAGQRLHHRRQTDDAPRPETSTSSASHARTDPQHVFVEHPLAAFPQISAGISLRLDGAPQSADGTAAPAQRAFRRAVHHQR